MRLTLANVRARTCRVSWPVCARWLVLIAAFAAVSRAGSARAAAGSSSGPGFSYQHDQIPTKPWSIHIVRIERSRHDLTLETTLGGGDRFGLGTLSEQVRTVPPDRGRPVAAINGDYFRNESPYLGDPKGLQIFHGELVSAPCDWTCLWADPSGGLHMTNVAARFRVTWPNGDSTPFGLNEEPPGDTAVLFTSVVGPSTHTSGDRELVLERDGTGPWLPLRVGQTYRARVRAVREAGDTPLTADTAVLSLGSRESRRLPALAPGSSLQISTATWPDLSGVNTAIGGGPPLVRGGKSIVHNEARVRHPRTAVGWDKDHLFFVEVDGRQIGLSVGMSNAELADYLVGLGCDDAMSLDGGGSATCWVFGQVMNSPSEGRERPMANALVLVRKENP